MSQEVVLYDPMGVQVALPVAPTPSTVVDAIPGLDYVVQDRYRSYVSKNITPARYSRILQTADQGDPREFFELCEEVLEKDPKLASVFNTRTAAVRGLNRELLPPELEDDATEAEKSLADEIARFVCKAIESANLNELITDGMDAIGKPFTVDWVEWGFNQEGKVVPIQFKKIPGTHIRWAFKKDEIRVYDPSTSGQMNDGELGLPLPARSTVRFLSNSRREHPTRSGLLRTLIWYHMFKLLAFKDFVTFNDRYGMPIRTAKIPSSQFTNEEFYSKIRYALRNLGTDASGIFSSDTELEILAAAKGGPESFDRMIDIVNREAAQLVLGHELSSQAATGTNGQQYGISAAEKVRQDILEGDCQWLAAIIKRDLIVPLVAWNFGEDKVYLSPTLWFEYEPPRDLLGAANVYKTVAETFPGLKFSEQQMRDEFGILEPMGYEPTEENGDVLMPSDKQEQPALQPPGTAPEYPQTIQKTLARRKRKGPPVTRYNPAQQKRVDRSVDRGIERGVVTLTSFERQLRKILKGLSEAGVTDMSEIRKRVVGVYPSLDVSDLEDTLYKQMLLVRLAGRQGG